MLEKYVGVFFWLHRKQKLKKRADDTLFMQSVLSETVSDITKIFLNYWMSQGF